MIGIEWYGMHSICVTIVRNYLDYISLLVLNVIQTISIYLYIVTNAVQLKSTLVELKM